MAANEAFARIRPELSEKLQETGAEYLSDTRCQPLRLRLKRFLPPACGSFQASSTNGSFDRKIDQRATEPIAFHCTAARYALLNVGSQNSQSYSMLLSVRRCDRKFQLEKANCVGSTNLELVVVVNL